MSRAGSEGAGTAGRVGAEGSGGSGKAVTATERTRPRPGCCPLGMGPQGRAWSWCGVRVRVPKTMSRAPAYFVPSRDRSPTPQRADLIRRSLAVFLTRTDPCLVSDLSEELLPEFCSLPLLIECLLDAVYFFFGSDL